MDLSLGETLLEAGYRRCGLCGDPCPEEELVQREIDAPGHWVTVCPECVMSMEEA
mgnify:CR=1 FL=1